MGNACFCQIGLNLKVRGTCHILEHLLLNKTRLYSFTMNNNSHVIELSIQLNC